MVDIKEISVSAEYGIHKLLISFTTTDCAEDFSRYRFDLYRGYNADGPFELYASDVREMQYVDMRVNLMNPTMHYYYKVRVIDTETWVSKMSDKVGYIEKHAPDRFASAIADIETLYLQNVIKNDTIYLARRMTCGTRCNCFDDIRNSSDPDCPQCLGTRYVGGYYPAHPLQVNYMTALSVSETMDPRAITEEMNGISFWCAALPVIRTNDLVIGQNNHRYMVTNVNYTYKNHCIIRQIVSAQWLAPSDPRYNVALEGDAVHG